jgi:hypothetical protein
MMDGTGCDEAGDGDELWQLQKSDDLPCSMLN